MSDLHDIKPAGTPSINDIRNLDSRYGHKYSNTIVGRNLEPHESSKVNVHIGMGKDNTKVYPITVEEFKKLQTTNKTNPSGFDNNEVTMERLNKMSNRNVDPEIPEMGVTHDQDINKGYIEQNKPPAVNFINPPSSFLNPGQQITYDLPGYGSLDVSYHQVIRNNDNLVLVWDKKYQGGGKFFPKDPTKPIAMHVKNTDKVFLVRAMNIDFELDGKELCVLKIEQEGSYNDYTRTETAERVSNELNNFPMEEVNNNGKTSSNIRRFDSGKSGFGGGVL